MTYNFQARFAPLVESGAKPSTIRADRKDGRLPKPGDILTMFTGMRTKACRRLGKFKCVRVSRIEFYGPVIRINKTHTLTSDEAEALAAREGFGSSMAMREWFSETHGLPFAGNLIEWDPTNLTK